MLLSNQIFKRSKKSLAQALVLGSLAGMVACGGGGGSASTGTTDESSTGTFSLSVTDAPIDSATQVVVQFAGVAIQPADGEVIEIVFDEPKSINLLDFQGTASAALIEGETIATGAYEWIRLDVSAEHDGVLDSFIELNDGTQLELFVPSGSQTGLKLVSGFTVAAGGSANFTVDFDLRKSVTNPRGLSGAILKPALRLIDNTTAGSIAGTIDATLVSTSCADASIDDGAVYVYSGANATPADVQGADTDPLITALVNVVDSEYRYEVGFLSEGTYTLAYTCDTGADDPAMADTLVFSEAANVDVTADTESALNFQ